MPRAKIIVSERGKLIAEDLKKIGKGAAIAGFGAAAFYVIEAIPSVDFGETWTPIIVAFFGVAANMFRKWWSENHYK